MLRGTYAVLLLEVTSIPTAPAARINPATHQRLDADQ
jgi:hypothetical protein